MLGSRLSQVFPTLPTKPRLVPHDLDWDATAAHAYQGLMVLTQSLSHPNTWTPDISDTRGERESWRPGPRAPAAFHSRSASRVEESSSPKDS